MEGSKHVLPDMDEMLRLIKPLAKRPSREIVVDDASEDTYLETQDNVADYDFGSRTCSAVCAYVRVKNGGFLLSASLPLFSLFNT